MTDPEIAADILIVEDEEAHAEAMDEGLKRLGHREDLAGWEGRGDDYFRVVPLKSLDGFPMGREFSAPSDG